MLWTFFATIASKIRMFMSHAEKILLASLFWI